MGRAVLYHGNSHLGLLYNRGSLLKVALQIVSANPWIHHTLGVRSNTSKLPLH